MRKLTYSFIKARFEKESYRLVSTEYQNAHTHLDYICPVGHKHSITWNNWQRGKRCPYCGGQGKPTIEQVRHSFEKEDYILLSDEYINSKTKLNYVCPNGHSGSVRWNNWNNGNRCQQCCANLKHSIAFVIEELMSEGYKVISDTYVNNTTKFSCRCPVGHIYQTSWASWRSGIRCPNCSGYKIPTIDFIMESFAKEGYTLLTNNFINGYSDLWFICPNGHTHKISWDRWKFGNRCKFCFADKCRLTYHFVKSEFEKEGYKLLSKKYTNAKNKLKYKCPYGHQHNITYDKWGQGNRCPTCAVINNSAENHYNWQGGKSFEKYCALWKDLEYKQDVSERDRNTCLNPSCSSKDTKDLTIHHIDYNKQNCNPKNLITICRSCNSRANKDRDWHKAWYQAIMYRRYNFKY